MSNEKFSVNLSRYAQGYLIFVSIAFIIAGAVCAGLFWNVFGLTDSVNAYILATELFHSMIRTTAAAVMMTLAIDLLSHRYGEE